jgi:2-C-methyl-D-erythritol 4-phosphate cytidylyltransferase
VKHTAILLAGSRPGADPLTQHFGAKLKALIPIGGEPMVARPARALLSSSNVGDIVVVAQSPERIRAALPDDLRIQLREAGDTIASTVLSLVEESALRWPVVVTTADHALLDESMIDQFCEDSQGADIAIAVVERDSLLRRLPQSKRTWLKFRAGAFTGANLFALASPNVVPAIDLWRSVEQDRKKSWRLIALAGPLVVAGAALRLLTIDQVLARLGRKLGVRMKAVRMKDPLAGVDVDKVEDHSLVEAILKGRA